MGLELGETTAQINETISNKFLGLANGEMIHYLDSRNLTAGLASGSIQAAGMAVLPCSMGSLARIAHGVSGNLIERAADVSLKEKRPLILAPRETPFNQIHIENMLTLARAGAHIVPCMPGFYNHPKSIGDLVDFVVCRVLNLLGVKHNLDLSWRSS